MEKTQREYYLNEQLKAIQRELGNGEGEEGDELAESAEKIAKTKLSKEARTKASAELKKLKAMQPMSAEATVVRNYLDVLLGLPWGKKGKVKTDLRKAQAILDEDHFALEKVKDRIIEYLAVQARTNKLKGPILCLVGPPGVGKTSLGRSIAKATGREFVRQSLGGVRDEAEIRGHRRTYIGSLPGKIVSNLKKAGTSNPLFLLAEIDKLGQAFRGAQQSALPEGLAPEKTSKFQNTYPICRQAPARPLERQGDRPRVRAPVTGRRARLGRDSRPPPHLYRFASGQDRVEPQEGRHVQSALPARRDRQAWPGFPRRSGVSVARGAGPRAEFEIPGPLSGDRLRSVGRDVRHDGEQHRSEEHTSELQSLMRISYAVFCLKKKKKEKINNDSVKNYKNTDKYQQMTISNENKL